MTSPESTIPPAVGDYEVDRQRHCAAMGAGLGEEVARLGADPVEIARIRDERLRGLLTHARTHSPWHRERLAGLEVDRLSSADVSALPSMTKADLMEHWDEIVCDPQLDLKQVEAHIERVAHEGPSYLHDRYHALATGGSTGRRAVVVWDFDGFRITGTRSPAWSLSCSAHLGLPTSLPIVACTVGSTGATHVGGAVNACFSNPERATYVSAAASQPMEEIVRILEEAQPVVLGGYASTLQQLAELKLAGRLDIAPAQVVQAGEPFLPEARAAVDAGFGCAVRDQWGASEIGWGGSSFPGVDGIVLCEDLVIVEPVDADRRPVGLGEPAAKLLVTNLVNRVLPLIRYEISDETTMVAPDPDCPWTGHRLLAIEGRRDDLFRYGDRTIHPHAFRTVLTTHGAIAEYQVRQTEHGADVDIVGAASDTCAALEGSIARALARAGLDSPRVRVTPVESIQRQPNSHKLKRFVPLFQPSECA
jgi:phenylacetate-coenzyme A ligase PaaK-like adenylate-forming protein